MTKRAIYFWGLLLILCASVGCVKRKPPVAAFVKPSVAPVSKPITEARNGVSQAAAQVTTAVARAERAAVLVKEVVENGTAANSVTAKNLSAEVGGLRTDLFRVTVQLRDAQDKLDEADRRLVDLDSTIARQTEDLNKVNSERINALASAAAAEAAAKNAQSEASALKRSLAWEKAKKWVVGGGLALLVGLAWVFKLIGAGSRFA